ncbi:hypothetical protein APY03_6585 [Variovorax sp. WDL1]|nr:hypothetical protein APY03_6585 [Variovorax sp. WDL1]
MDAAQTTLERVVRSCAGWEIVPESYSPLPDTRNKLRGG